MNSLKKSLAQKRSILSESPILGCKQSDISASPELVVGHCHIGIAPRLQHQPAAWVEVGNLNCCQPVHVPDSSTARPQAAETVLKPG